MARKKNRVSVTRKLHRTFGAGAAIFILLMVLSGLAINHAEGLKLQQRLVSQPWVLDWYGLDEPGDIRSFNAGGRWLSFVGSQLYHDGNPVSPLANGIGVVFDGTMIIAAGSNELILLDNNGVLIERVPWNQPEPIESVGLLNEEAIVIKTASGLWQADAQLFQWQSIDETDVTPLWPSSESAPSEIRQAVTAQYRGSGMSLERLVFDLHSGRIFGSVGVLVYDFLALLVGFLAISGLVLWARGRKNGKVKRKK
jgi:hypothetical protein